MSMKTTPSSASGTDIADLDDFKVDGANIVLPDVKIALQQICTEAGACLGIVWKLEGTNLKVVDEYFARLLVTMYCQ